MNYLKKVEREVQSQRIVASTIFGTIFHWYSFYVLGVILNEVVKDQLELNVAIGNSFTIIALIIGFFIRPVGSFFFSPLIDQMGRKALFNRSLTLISISLALILFFPFKLFPSVVSLGVLFLSRMLQGVAISIEYGSALSYIYESVSNKKVGLYVGMLQITPPLGFIGANLIHLISTLIFEDTDYNSFIWRFPLIIGLLLFSVTYYLRSSLEESTEFSYIKKESQILEKPTVSFFKKTNLFKMIYSFLGVSIVQGILYYFIYSFMKRYLIHNFQVSPISANYYLVAVTTFVWPIILIVGAISDRICARKMYLWTLVFNLVSIIGGTILIEKVLVNYNLWLSFIPISLMAIGALSIYSLSGRILAELFPVSYRGTGISIPYHIGNGIFGGLIVLFALLGNTSDSNFLYEKIYVVIFLIIAIVFNTLSITSKKDIFNDQQLVH